jgi:hypothetical protein
MTPPIDKYKKIRNRILRDKGDLDFFGLILREDAPDVWDLVVSAPWAEADTWSALQYLSNVVKAELEPAELLQLSRVVILEKGNPVLQALLAALAVTGDSVAEYRDSTVGGIHFRHAYVLEAKSPVAAGASAA